MGVQNDEYHSLEITLTGSNNKTLKGLLNFTALQEEEEVYDSKGAATFVIVVILVYGLSIVLMIGSLAKKNMKVKDIDAEEKQIHRYLNQANDLREEGAKENYRQLKRNIISIVNKSPEDSMGTPPDISQDFGPNALRSMLAVGSPWAAATAVAKARPENPEGTPQASGRRSRLVSETESLQALLEEDEPDDRNDTPRTSPKSGADSGVTASQPTLSGARLKTPKETVVVSEPPGFQPRMSIAPQVSRQPAQGSTSRVEFHPKPVNGLPQQHSRIIPQVVVSDPEEHRQQGPNSWLKPLDINRAKQHHISQLEKDHKIICNVDGSTLQEPGKSCKLSMDAEGNIWILQSSPDPGSNSQRRIPASPSISTPGSIGYESLRGTSRSASPSPVPRQTPSPGVPGVHYSGHQPRASPREPMTHPPIQVPPYRTDQRDRSRSPSPKYGCFDSKPQPTKTISTSTSFSTPGERRSPNRSPEPPGSRLRTPANIRYATSSPKPDCKTGIYPKTNNGGYPCPPTDTDDEELVQITSV